MILKRLRVLRTYVFSINKEALPVLRRECRYLFILLYYSYKQLAAFIDFWYLQRNSYYTNLKQRGSDAILDTQPQADYRTIRTI